MHLQRHGVRPAEAEFVVEHAERPFPQDAGDDKRVVWGATVVGRMIQVIYVLIAQDEIAYGSLSDIDWLELEETPDAKVLRIIHAMDLTEDMKRRLRRRRR